MHSYRATVRACFVGYAVQAVINNFLPLLFTTFMADYGLSLTRISLLVTFNFGVQLLVDVLAGLFADRIGYRRCMIAAHVFCAAGLAGLTFLPNLLPVPFWGILLSVTVYAVGGGLLEVLVSPIVEHCPGDDKAGAMSLLHSFYCWGTVAVVLLSTLFFSAFGTKNWRILALLWALLPAANAVVFTRVPIPASPNEAKGGRLGALFRCRLFPAVLLLMFCAGASEQAVSQWASAFTESALHVSKTTGDLLGTMMFSILMGAARLFYGRKSAKIPLRAFMLGSGLLCVGSYLLISLTRSPVPGLIGCALCGLAVGIFWPGTTSLAAGSIPGGGTAMFALMALFGDVGCASGPTFVGTLADRLGGLRSGVLAAVMFPALLLVGLLWFRRAEKKTRTDA
ncbi:MAG: MFS transporter [Clostridia bacterium]|nr:MFS transporter [Clostridia bacterium]